MMFASSTLVIQRLFKRRSDYLKPALLVAFFTFVGSIEACSKRDCLLLDSFEVVLDTSIVYSSPNTGINNPKSDSGRYLSGKVSVVEYSSLGYSHQSAAVYGDYVFFVTGGRQAIYLYDLKAKKKVHEVLFKIADRSVYHCNQCTFGTEKYDSNDPFPLLYISQRSNSDGRCFTEVFRIIPTYATTHSFLLGFNVELVQIIYFPPMTRYNSMGNVNCVIDSQSGRLYTYSRNNDASDDNYGQCKISRFVVPDFCQKEVFLEDTDIVSSFFIDISAINMQGACVVEGQLYIGQGYPYVNYVYLNVVDLERQHLVKRYDLLAQGCDWEPEGCFFYDGNIMLSHTGAICRIIEED